MLGALIFLSTYQLFVKSTHFLQYLDDDVFHYDVDDDNDEDYVPVIEKTKSKFKKPKLSDIKVFKGKQTVVKKIKVLKGTKKDIFDTLDHEINGKDKGRKATTITCCKYTVNCTISIILLTSI